MFYDPNEGLSRSELDALALQRFQETLARASKSPAYQKKNLPSTLRSLQEVRELPFTLKQDLRDAFPYGFLAAPLESCVRLHSSSGTTGNPTVMLYTQNDLDNWSKLMARCMSLSGANRHDIFQNIMGYGLFTGGIGFHYGAERLGMLTIPIGPGNSKRQGWFMKHLGVSVVHILPSYAFRLYSHLKEEGVDPKELPLRIAFIGAEPHSEAMRREIERLYGIKAFNSFGLSEMNGPGVAFECQEQSGMHLWEDYYYAEIIDPETLEVLPDGEWGELVISSIHREAMPLVRYRTRDLTRIIPEPCKCGRVHRRIDRIKGRTDDMLIINGVNLFPMQIEKTILGMKGVGSHYIIEVHKEQFLDKLYVKIEMTEEAFSGSLSELEVLQKSLTAALTSELGVNPKVKLVERGSLPVEEGKAKRVYDYREKELA